MEKRIVKTENISFKLSEIPLTRKELRNILNYRIPCLCCGQEMIHPDTYTELIENPLLASTASVVIPILEPYEKLCILLKDRCLICSKICRLNIPIKIFNSF